MRDILRTWIFATALITCVTCALEDILKVEFGGPSRKMKNKSNTAQPNLRPLLRAKLNLRRAKSVASPAPSSSASRSGSSQHPLDPLSEAEINTTVSIIRKLEPRESVIFNTIDLKEPEKALLLPYFLKDKNPPADIIPRKSFTVLYDRTNLRTYEVTVDLDTKRVEKWDKAPNGVDPMITANEMEDAEKIGRESPEVIERCKEKGWTDMSMVNGDPWCIGYIGDRPELQGRRLIQLLMYGMTFKGDNMYAHPFDFLVIVDVNERRMIAIEDLPTHNDYDVTNKEGNNVPRTSSNYFPSSRSPTSYRDDLRPINISQPDGASYTVDGNEIRWQKYKMRVGFNGREGLVIYNVNYKDGSEVRPLFYRMSLAEMFVPYGDPRPPYHRKHVNDEGQYGIGYNCFVLQPQQDCLGEVYFFDAVVHDEQGKIRQMPRAVCLNEEDAGILWKHTDHRTGESTVVRSQRLALTFIATVGNYDYLFAWNFYQDGTIEFDIKLSGILSTTLLAEKAAGYGTTVFPQINAQYHQHFFTVRLDAEIDGNKNTVVVSDVVSHPEPTGSLKNPYGQGFTTRQTVLRTAGSARTNISPRKSRTWHIRNPNKIHPYTKQPVGWKLMPWPSPPLMLKRDSPIRQKAEWFDYSTWVTPYVEDRFFPGGFYLNNSGLPEWVGENLNANVENTDIVLWYNFGVSHVPRVEDFPVMPVERLGIKLKPVNFFMENPALDVPPPNLNRTRDEL